MNEKILVVDDEKSLLKSIEETLSEEGYDVTTTGYSHEALNIIKNEFFDLIVMDIRMPGMDGISLLKEIRKVQDEDNKSRVILITAYASEDAPIKAIKLGADDYLMKPFELEDFLHSVKRNLRISRLERERNESLEQLEELHTKYKNLVGSLSKVVWLKTKDKDLEKKVREILKNYEKA
ncbi:MAG: response regulator [Candidatus Altiarchaeales archaeon]|nr:response regulator [Candidatus Altiarchaeales archaeon]